MDAEAASAVGCVIVTRPFYETGYFTVAVRPRRAFRDVTQEQRLGPSGCRVWRQIHPCALLTFCYSAYRHVVLVCQRSHAGGNTNACVACANPGLIAPALFHIQGVF